MKMYNPSGDKVLVDKAQIPALELAGWTKEPPEVKDEPETDVESADVDEASNAGEKKTIPVRRKKTVKKA